MVLAMTVKDKRGNIVLLKGTELSERHITIMSNRDVRSVVVEGTPVERKGGDVEAWSREVDRRFCAAGSSPVVVKIKEIMKGLLS